MKKPVWKYHTSLSFVHEGKKHFLLTQLYQIGVYAIFDNDPAQQMNLKPQQLVKGEKAFVKDFADGKITDLVLGTKISVTTDEDGFYVKVEDEK